MAIRKEELGGSKKDSLNIELDDNLLIDILESYIDEKIKSEWEKGKSLCFDYSSIDYIDDYVIEGVEERFKESGWTVSLNLDDCTLTIF